MLVSVNFVYVVIVCAFNISCYNPRMENVVGLYKDRRTLLFELKGLFEKVSVNKK